MPTNAVKTPKDERLWEKAKAQARKKKPAPTDFYAYTMGIYQQMKGNKSMQPILIKAKVRAHVRHTKSGKAVQVREHQDSREKRAAADKKYLTAVARTIQQQIGHQALYMIGAKQFIMGHTESRDPYLQFRIGRNSKGVHIVKIILNQMDTYNVEFSAVRKGPKHVILSTEEGIYNDMLTGSIERNTGMATSLGTMGKAKVRAHLRRTKGGKIVPIREHQDIRVKRQKGGSVPQWIATTLANDENSTDAQLVSHFKTEGKMSDAEAKHYVAQRQNFLKKPMSAELKPHGGKHLSERQQLIEYERGDKRSKQVREYDVSHAGGSYVTTHLDLKGRGITQKGDGSDHARGLKTYHITEAAFKKVQQEHGEFHYRNKGESLTRSEQARKDANLMEKNAEHPLIWKVVDGPKGSVLITTDIDLKGAGIKLNSISHNRERNYTVSEAAFEKLKKKFGNPKLTKSMEGEPMTDLSKYPDLKKAVEVGSLSKSLEFTKTGTEIYNGIMAKLGACQGELQRMIAKWKAGVQPVSDDSPVGEASEVAEKPEREPWEIRSKRREIDKLERIARNIDTKKKYKLSEYELAEYGL